MEKYYFLCGSSGKNNFVYAIKSDESDWHYFEEVDSLLDAHDSLPRNLIHEIRRLNKVKPIALTLNADQMVNYVNNGKFVFKGKELKTYIQLSGKSANQRDHRDQSNPRKKSKLKSTHDLVFEAGKTNPATFLKEFEKCPDLKSEKDKLYKLRHFVNEHDRVEFSTLFMGSDWQTARSVFLKKYSLQFTENKKKELCFSFEEETSLRSFAARKMNAFAVYTTLSVQNQLEVILSELPNEIANFFTAEDKLNCTQAEILEFCDLIQEYSERTITEHTEETDSSTDSVMPSVVVQELEIFNFQEGDESLSDTASTSTNSSGCGMVKKMRRSSRLVKIPGTISEELQTSSDSEFSQMDEH